MVNNFWLNKKVLITGHSGFKGSWLTIWLNQLGANVVGCSLDSPTSPSLFQLSNIESDIRSLYIDIRDRRAVYEAFSTYKPEIVFHLAAQSLVRYSYLHPVETYQTNVMGTLHVLEAIRNTPSIRSVIMVTTDKCYENNDWEWGYREIDPLGGEDLYSSSKASMEHLISSYRCSYFSDNESGNPAIASVRAGNVIGGGDWAEDRLIPDILEAFEKNKPVYIRYPNATRPWQHVLEPLSGYIKLAEKLYFDGAQYIGAWNFGPNQVDAKPVMSVVKMMAELWGENASWKVDESAHPSEANHLMLDCSKAYRQLHWYPRWDLGEALEKTIEWHKATSKTKQFKECCVRQIDDYMDKN